ncbi:aminodeoxychorismate lyase [Shewanella sp. VB17]|uniref:aminodeoxychorismate lyase n=1 Tax=Shewanella sp. VB17 TaxID=2739432 RepID=UPI001566BEEB|nr:aminodeoxychorismate lyase [Shewanella sp. VB17]NRD74440.1 aminodeoxychorismate lyase [Shewanella sp. VB17]
MTQVWVNGIVAEQMDPLDRGLAYGDGLFATMRFSDGQVQFLAAHFARLVQGARRLGFQWEATDDLIELLNQIALNQTHGCIKLLLTRGVGGRGYAAPTCSQVNEVVSLYDVPSHYIHWQKEGIALTLSEFRLSRQPRLAGIKHLNRLEQVLIKSMQLPNGFDDWLVLDTDKRVIESSMANLFFITGNVALTPAITHSGVAGMMREQVIYALIELGYDVDVTEVNYGDLTLFEHVFMTNSLLGLVDINRIDNMTYSISPFSDTLRQTLHLTL